jgi:hypothetical protein
MELTELGLTEEQLLNVQKAIQSETDKVRTDYSTKLKTANDELTKYKPVEKSDSEKALEEKERLLAEKEKEIANKEKAYSLKDKLSAKGLPSDLAQFLNVGEDVDKSLEDFSSTLNNLLLNNAYKPSNHNKSEGVSKDDFKKMSYSERLKLSDTNPELYKRLAE